MRVSIIKPKKVFSYGMSMIKGIIFHLCTRFHCKIDSSREKIIVLSRLVLSVAEVLNQAAVSMY